MFNDQAHCREKTYAVQGFEPLGYSDERPAPGRMLTLAARLQAALDERGC